MSLVLERLVQCCTRALRATSQALMQGATAERGYGHLSKYPTPHTTLPGEACAACTIQIGYDSRRKIHVQARQVGSRKLAMTNVDFFTEQYSINCRSMHLALQLWTVAT